MAFTPLQDLSMTCSIECWWGCLGAMHPDQKFESRQWIMTTCFPCSHVASQWKKKCSNNNIFRTRVQVGHNTCAHMTFNTPVHSRTCRWHLRLNIGDVLQVQCNATRSSKSCKSRECPTLLTCFSTTLIVARQWKKNLKTNMPQHGLIWYTIIHQ